MKQLDERRNNPERPPLLESEKQPPREPTGKTRGRPTSGNPPKESTGNPSPRHKIGNWTKNLEEFKPWLDGRIAFLQKNWGNFHEYLGVDKTFKQKYKNFMNKYFHIF